MTKGEAKGHHGTIVDVDKEWFTDIYIVQLDAPRVKRVNGKRIEITVVECKANEMEPIREI